MSRRQTRARAHSQLRGTRRQGAFRPSGAARSRRGAMTEVISRGRASRRSGWPGAGDGGAALGRSASCASCGLTECVALRTMCWCSRSTSLCRRCAAQSTWGIDPGVIIDLVHHHLTASDHAPARGHTFFQGARLEDDDLNDWSDPERQQPVADTTRREPSHPDAVLHAELDRALADRDPLHGIAQLLARLAAAFMLNTDGITCTKALGSERMNRKLQDALPGGPRSAAPSGSSCGRCSPQPSSTCTKTPSCTTTPTAPSGWMLTAPHQTSPNSTSATTSC